MKTLLLSSLLLSSLSAFSALNTKECPQSLTASFNEVQLGAFLSLENQTGTKCTYKGLDNDGCDVSASINFGTRKGQTNKAILRVRFIDTELMTITSLKSVSLDGVVLANKYSAKRGRKVRPTKILRKNRYIGSTKAYIE